ncbi:MAG: FliH/SctL family protein [Eubacteriales bacterium]|nr:FliH/SctL family protein [Eubacteriales bacterium]MDD3199249.1 FliH/SctL family protein [Eubacteriales bacterium]MDD4121408.1 FliH/SctL family protein [Eubacteriales bacterium]MDD4629380.1 FliH/SctL family protein [Eubacteriales bacterium]
MISLSSIVKARQLTSLPFKDNIDCLPEVPEQVKIENTSRDIKELINKKEAILSQAAIKAKHIENEAELRAESIIENAVKRSREIMNTAEKNGYEEGYLRGLVDGASASEIAAEDSLLELRSLIKCFDTEQRERLKNEESNLINIAFELSKKIMKQQIKIDEEAIIKMLSEIIQENEESMKIYLSEYQKTLSIRIDKAMAKKIKNRFNGAKFVLLKEEDLIMGESDSGIVDMSIPAQLEQMKKAISHAT